VPIINRPIDYYYKIDEILGLLKSKHSKSFTKFRETQLSGYILFDCGLSRNYFIEKSAAWIDMFAISCHSEKFPLNFIDRKFYKKLQSREKQLSQNSAK
jgi:hypothetical protein